MCGRKNLSNQERRESREVREQREGGDAGSRRSRVKTPESESPQDKTSATVRPSRLVLIKPRPGGRVG